MFAANSGVFPLTALGLTAGGVTKLQTDQLFTELFSALISPTGRFGSIIPTAIATNAGGQYLFGNFVRRGALASLYDFENRRPKSPVLPKGGKWFDVHPGYKFCLLSLTGRATRADASRIGFFLSSTADIDDPSRVLAVAPDDLARMSPNTGTLPSFRTQRDADLTAEIYRRFPALQKEGDREGNPWNIDFKYVFRSTNDRDILHTREEFEDGDWRLQGHTFMRERERALPLYEAKMVDFFNHRAADVIKSPTAVNRQNQPDYLSRRELQDPTRQALPMNWVQDAGMIETVRKGKKTKVPGVDARLRGYRWNHDWLCGWCDVTASTNERTSIPAFIPRVATLHTFPLMLPLIEPQLVAALIATQSSLVFDFVSRQKISDAHMKLFIWKQLPVPAPTVLEPHLPFLLPRVIELVYTAYDMTPLALDLGDEQGPFRWDDDRRAQIRAELDAYFFHLYGISREDTDYILETFQSPTGGLKNNEIAKFGEYRTKRLVLTEYDRMATASLSLDTPLDVSESGTYRSTLTPPPGNGPRHPVADPYPSARDSVPGGDTQLQVTDDS